jgi:hypothetical protein
MAPIGADVVLSVTVPLIDSVPDGVVGVPLLPLQATAATRDTDSHTRFNMVTGSTLRISRDLGSEGKLLRVAKEL